MVNNIIFSKIENRLEKFLIYKNEFKLTGDNYELVLFIPNESSFSQSNYTLLLSAKKLNALSQRDILMQLLSNFHDNLEPIYYNAISRINIINTNDSFVKNLKFIFPVKNHMIEINDIAVGGVNIEHGILIKPSILDKLIEGKILVLEIKSSEGAKFLKALIVKINQSFEVVYLTDLGINELKFNLDNLNANYISLIEKYTEQYMLDVNMMGKVYYDDIIRVSHFY